MSSEGWVAILHDDTVAMDTVLRIAGAYRDGKVPLRDVGEAILKMAKWGQFSQDGKRDADLGGLVADQYDDRPCREALRALCLHSGARVSEGGMVDFSTADRYIAPTATETELLSLLTWQTGNYAPSCWLARHMAARPSRSQVDYKILPSVPFVLKAKNAPARLLGVTIPEEDLHRGPSDIFVGMTQSRLPGVVALLYRVNEEAVEGNSFNIRPECRDFVHGTFTESVTGRLIRYDKNGRDARKFIGVGVAIREMYPDYEPSEVVYVVVDRVSGRARVLVGMRYDGKFERQVAALLENGVDRDIEAEAMAA